ncbi:NADH dehydrogenase [ubiquinone] 1 beta subcomplex subunit 11, mitochondrial [Halyomorpha halys]|uniref:NADH dehydrogenase [ubiquinone] 1 beta subcomplex subunit 11, mitochondrial n=1 Tax=Halyomorpha halys TaxID=286706 RepID=UPI0006D515D2|nr:NADH dehydrogenase [ubiquinone] 1 beta subcomplex subunit 11, mitochondrial [Halyomorpha halys]
MSSLVRSKLFSNLRNVPLVLKPLHIRCISTSKKNRDPAAMASANPECDTKPKNWISYGFSETDMELDRHVTHVTMFLGFTLIMVIGGFLLAYRPDPIGRDWAQREAFLELRRREQNGLPLIDPDYLPLDKIKLPTDEELGDTEIVI